MQYFKTAASCRKADFSGLVVRQRSYYQRKEPIIRMPFWVGGFPPVCPASCFNLFFIFFICFINLPKTPETLSHEKPYNKLQLPASSNFCVKPIPSPVLGFYF